MIMLNGSSHATVTTGQPMLIRAFHHVDVQLSELGTCQTVNSSVKHRLPLPTPSLSWHVLDAINESLKEKNRYNLTWLC